MTLICWHLPLYFILIVWLRFVNHLLNYYLLTYLRMNKSTGKQGHAVFIAPLQRQSCHLSANPAQYASLRWNKLLRYGDWQDSVIVAGRPWQPWRHYVDR